MTMASGIILCGASSIGKSTLACDWVKEHNEYSHIDEIARDIMRANGITRDDLVASIAGDKKVFLELQLAIIEEQNRRESELAGLRRPFISDRGPDPLVYASLHAGPESADRLAGHPSTQACFQRYRVDCLVVILCPLPHTVDDGFRMVPESRESQDKFNDALRSLLDRHHVPYIYVGVTDRKKRISALRDALLGTLSVRVEEFLGLKAQPRALSVAFRASTVRRPSAGAAAASPCARNALCRVDVTCETITLSHSLCGEGKTNRMAHRYGADNMIVMSFDRKVSTAVVAHVVSAGVWVNGREFNFLGCSSSGLKSRTCYMFAGTKEKVEAVLAECFSLKKDVPVSKKLKRVGMLFSELKLTSVTVPDTDVVEVPDIERNGFNFTDGCGGISEDLAQKVKEGAGISQLDLPSVYQIRYQGCKGVVALDPTLDCGKLIIRPSMKKCQSGSKPFLEVGLCDYSQPYTYGHLNRQFIMLFSALGIKDEVFLKKQENYFTNLEKLMHDPEVTIQMLHWKNMPELARKVAECQSTIRESKVLKRELAALQNKLLGKVDRLQILIPESRCIFGICDPLGILMYGQCFVRPTIAGKPTTVVGSVTVAKNPCYLLGDVRVLTAVDEPHLNHLVNCIVFPTRGTQPHPTEMAGSDLDGDQYFVCWDKDLILPLVHKPYKYPETSGAENSNDVVQYFAAQQPSMGLIDTCYKFWADYKGVQSLECQGLGKLFSRSVDATKTGDCVIVPSPFQPPRDLFAKWKEDHHHPDISGGRQKVWQMMDQRAAEMLQKHRNDLVSEMIQTNVTPQISEDFVQSIISDQQRGISEYQTFLFIQQWIESQQFSPEEAITKLRTLSAYIDYGKFTIDEQKAAIDKGIPLSIVTNALNSSQLLSDKMLCHFLLDTPHAEWHYYLHSMGANVDWQHLIRAVREFPESLFVFQLSDETYIGLHFLCSIEKGDMIPLKPGSIISYIFSPHYNYYQRQILVGNYYISLDDNVMQIYRNKTKSQSFVWMANSHEVHQKLGNAILLFDCISVDLTQFKGARPKHPLINKQQITCFEVFVKSDDPNRAYFDLLEASQSSPFYEAATLDDIEELPIMLSEDADFDTTLLCITPETAELVLNTSALNGHTAQFRMALQTLSVNQKLDGMVIADALNKLLEALVFRFIHLSKLPDTATDDLQVILLIGFDNQCYKSSSISIQIMRSLSLLQCQELLQQYLLLFLQSMQLANFSEYLECISNWQAWCIFSHDVSKQVASNLYELCKSLISSSVDMAAKTPCESLTQLSTDNISTVQDSMVTPLTIMNYVLHFSFLALQMFICDVNTRGCQDHSSQNKDILQKLKASAAPMEESDEDDPHDSKLWKVNFIGGDTVSQAFRPGVYVRLRAMTKESTSIFVGVGRITQLSWNPTTIVADVLAPVPVCLRQSAHQGRGHWEIEILGNVTTFVRKVTALCSLIDHPLRCPLRNILVHHDSFSPAEIQPSTSVQCNSTDTEMLTSGSTFNQSQLRAIKASLSNMVTLIQGPPGTGKTHVACEIIRQQSAKKHTECVLAVAETNMAVDNLTMQLHNMGLRVVRVGSEAKMATVVRHLTIDYQVEQKRKTQGKRPQHITFPSPRLAKQMLKAAQVVTTTCSGAGDPLLEGMKFHFVVIDEATQATELATLIPIVHHCSQLTLIGDPEQLSPTILNMEDCKGRSGVVNVPHISELKTTLFHHLQGKVDYHFLNEQHRMLQALCEFPSSTFYGGLLKTACTLQSKEAIDFEWPDKSRPLVFIDTCSPESSYRHSYANEHEADVVMNVVKSLLKLQISPFEMVILTPYQAQVQCIFDKLSREVAKVDVCTIDSFQGREKDVVIFSTVRCNAKGSLGFVDDRYRMNVLLTRAKRGLIGLGSKSTLCSGSLLWNKWLQHVPCIDEKDFCSNTFTTGCGNTTCTGVAQQRKKKPKKKYPHRFQ